MEVNACCGSENSTTTVMISTFLSKVRVVHQSDIEQGKCECVAFLLASPCRCHFCHGPWGPFGEICLSQALFLCPDMMDGGFSLCEYLTARTSPVYS